MKFTIPKDNVKTTADVNEKVQALGKDYIVIDVQETVMYAGDTVVRITVSRQVFD